MEAAPFPLREGRPQPALHEAGRSAARRRLIRAHSCAPLHVLRI